MNTTVMSVLMSTSTDMGAGERVLLVGIAPSGAELGAIITQIEKVAKRLEKEL